MIETDTSTLTDRFVYEPYDAATHLIVGLLGEGHSAGSTPCRMRWTKRPVRVLVLPEPGPARVS
jgi:hypothetical protein